MLFVSVSEMLFWPCLWYYLWIGRRCFWIWWWWCYDYDKMLIWWWYDDDMVQGWPVPIQTLIGTNIFRRLFDRNYFSRAWTLFVLVLKMYFWKCKDLTIFTFLAEMIFEKKCTSLSTDRFLWMCWIVGEYFCLKGWTRIQRFPFTAHLLCINQTLWRKNM